MPKPESKYMYSALEIDAFNMADSLERMANNRDVSLGALRLAAACLRQLASDQNKLRGATVDAPKKIEDRLYYKKRQG